MVLVAISLLMKARPKMIFLNHFAKCVALRWFKMTRFTLKVKPID
jgi:hypothetical protein